MQPEKYSKNKTTDIARTIALTISIKMRLGYECETAVIKMQRMYALLATLTFLFISFQLPQQSEALHRAAAPCDRSRKVFTEPYGEISDGPSGYNYTQDSHCEWLIKAKNDSQFITLTFHSMGTECSYDYIYVYDGDSFNSTLLGSFSGRTQPQRLVARSGSVSISMTQLNLSIHH